MSPDDAERGVEPIERPDDVSPSVREETASEATASGMDGVTVVVDLREPTNLRMLTLDHPDVGKWHETQLVAADIIVNGVGFERKTPSDFASSMTEGRLKEQAEKLGDAFEHAYILLEGGFDDFGDLEHTRLKAQSARGMAASLTARFGIPVIPCADGPTLVDMAVRLGRKHTEEPVSDYLPSGSVGLDEPPGKKMWGVLPHVGPALAERLFEEFGSPLDFKLQDDGETPLERIQRVDGIGSTNGEDICLAMTTGGETDD